MKRFLMQRDWRWIGVAAAVLLAGLVALWIKPGLEEAARERIEAAARRHGVTAKVGTVHLGLWPLLRLEQLDLDAGHGLRLKADSVAATWFGQWRMAVRAAAFSGPSGISASSAGTTWKVSGFLGNELQLALLAPQSGLTLRRRQGRADSSWKLEAQGLELSGLLDLRRDDQPLFTGGKAQGAAELHASAEEMRFHADVGARGIRLGALSAGSGEDPPLGDPTDLTLQLEGRWQRDPATLALPTIRATFAGAVFSGSLALTDLDTDPAIDLSLGMQRLDFAQLLGSSGLEVPESLSPAPGRGHDLGSATIAVQVRGKLGDPTSLSVTQNIEYTRPRELPPAITRLRGDFSFRPGSGTGQNRSIEVSPASPDFIGLRDIPPLFLRTLLLAEDSAFYGHRGIDLREIPGALITNWSRGGAARGASTLTQQLAKNLFLSRDKQVGRKLQELAITFLLEAALGKERILEIYLNIIEWGSEIRGLRPAARHYFDCEPSALTPAQMAFLVSIIPGPILYQRSFASGAPGPGLRLLVAALLAKLRSVEALSEQEYQQAVADPIYVGGEDPGRMTLPST